MCIFKEFQDASLRCQNAVRVNYEIINTTATVMGLNENNITNKWQIQIREYILLNFRH
jgi:hypothetical protein